MVTPPKRLWSNPISRLRRLMDTYCGSPLCLKLRERLGLYAVLIRLDRPIGIYLLLWPTLWALWIAGQGRPDPKVLTVFVLGVILMRSAGCAINDYADRHIDPQVERTKHRPLAQGEIHPREALLVFAVLALAAFALVSLLNTLTILMSLVGVVLAGSYPFMKRFHHLPQVHLGAAFGWAVPMAFTAQTGQLPSPAGWLLFIATVLWATAYDTMYAMADREDDLRIGVKSTAILFGEADRAIIAFMQALLITDLVLVGVQAGLGLAYNLGVAVAAVLAVYQQGLIARREPVQCFRAFLNNNYLGMAVFGGILVHYLLAS